MKFKEDNFQKSVCRFLDLNKVLWCHVANERKTSQQQGKRLKLKGVKSGVPDVLIFEPNNKYIGLAIELKIKPNEPTENQLNWLNNLNKKGWYTAICYNFNEFEQEFKKYYNETTKKN